MYYGVKIVGYLRAVLMLMTCYLHEEKYWVSAAGLMSFSFLLDGIDGPVARFLKQTSAFGAVLDVMVDLLCRGLVWTIVSPMMGCVIVWWEWLTFLATSTIYGKNWKTLENPPYVVHLVMRNNFKTVVGFYAVGSIFLLPLFLYINQFVKPDILTPAQQHFVVYALVGGRILALLAEAWYVKQYIMRLLQQD